MSYRQSWSYFHAISSGRTGDNIGHIWPADMTQQNHLCDFLQEEASLTGTWQLPSRPGDPALKVGRWLPKRSPSAWTISSLSCLPTQSSTSTFTPWESPSVSSFLFPLMILTLQCRRCEKSALWLLLSWLLCNLVKITFMVLYCGIRFEDRGSSVEIWLLF